MRRNVVCVRAGTSLESVTNVLLTEGYRCLPVVDADSRPIGIVTKSDVLRDWRENDPDGRVANDVMTPLVHALPETAPLSFAVALMASERLLEVPVVDQDGKVVGVVTAVEALAWLAKRFGYVLP